MICLDCGSNITELVGDVILENKTIGRFIVENVFYHKCDNCGELLFPLETLKTIEAKEKEIKEYRLSQYPIADFIVAIEAAEILGVTRQALHRNRRIRRGFIYFMNFGGKIAYLKKSVELYRDTGDGRLLLAAPYVTKQPEYIKETEIPSIERTSFKPITINLGHQPRWQQNVDTLSEFGFVYSSSQPVSLNNH